MVQLCQSLVGESGNVIATAGGDRSAAYVTDQFGVSGANLVRYRGKSVADLVAEVQAANGGRGVDVAFDMVGADMKRLCLSAAGYGGRVVSIVEEGRTPDFNGARSAPRVSAPWLCVSLPLGSHGSVVHTHERSRRRGAVEWAQECGIPEQPVHSLRVPGGSSVDDERRHLGLVSHGAVSVRWNRPHQV